MTNVSPEGLFCQAPGFNTDVPHGTMGTTKSSAPTAAQECSLSIMVVMLLPTIMLMLVVGIVAWLMMYRTAFHAVDMLASQGQISFVQATRMSLLSYTAAIQNIHSVNYLKWANTSVGLAREVKDFDAMEDIRITLQSQANHLNDEDTMGMTLLVAFYNGAALRYQRTSTGDSWGVFTGDELYRYPAGSWNSSWRNGKVSLHPPCSNVSNFNLTNAQWFQDAVRTGAQSWSSIVYSTPCFGMSLPAVLPVYYSDRRLKLVALAQPCLKEFDGTLAQLKVTQNTIAFVAEMDGKLIASIPEGQATIRVAHNDTANRSKRTSVFEAVAPLSDAAQWLQRRFGSLAGVPTEDSRFTLYLGDERYFLQTGHVRDEYGLHWIVVIGVPRSDLVGDLNEATAHAMGALAAVLCASVATMAALTWTIRKNLQTFAQHIACMGEMDLEGVAVANRVLYLQELRPVLRSIQQTTASLLQIRTFLPKPMLDRVKNEESMSDMGSVKEVTAAFLLPSQPEESNGTDTVTHTPRGAGTQRQNGSLHQQFAHRATTVQTLFERHMDYANVTLLFIELPELNRALAIQLPPSDLILWYDVCLSSTHSIVQKNAGDFYRLVGDQLLFMWGVVRRSAAHFSRGCHAALQIAACFEELDAGPPVAGLHFRPQISVVTGTVVCGVMGTANMRDLYLIGPLLQHGSRIASLNGAYETKILVDSAVAKQCETMFKLKACGLVRASSEGPLDIEFVYELISSIDSMVPNGDDEWMYKLILSENDAAATLYMKALDFLRKGLIPQATSNLEKVVEAKPDERHAHRWLKRIKGRHPTLQGVEGLID